MTLKTIATPLTIASFIGVGVTGICLLLGLHGGLVAPLHELSSIVFVVGSILHLILHRHAIRNHLRSVLGKGLALLFVAVAIVALTSFLHTGSSGSGSPYEKTMEIVMNQNLQEFAQFSNQSVESLTQRLTQAGFQVEGKEQTLKSITEKNHRNPMQVLATALP